MNKTATKSSEVKPYPSRYSYNRWIQKLLLLLCVFYSGVLVINANWELALSIISFNRGDVREYSLALLQIQCLPFGSALFFESCNGTPVIGISCRGIAIGRLFSDDLKVRSSGIVSRGCLWKHLFPLRSQLGQYNISDDHSVFSSTILHWLHSLSLGYYNIYR